MKLIAEQIECLYQFTRKHYVEWYDLQTELVDHLANSIEAQWQENPKISFEDALQVEFKKFGVFGFMEVVEQRQLVLNKKYNSIIWKHFKAFFTIPKIIVTLGAIIATFLSLSYLSNRTDVVLIVFVIIVLSFYFSIIFFSRKNRKANKLTHKKWLFKEIILGRSSLVGMTYLPIQIFIHSEKVMDSAFGIFIISFLIVAMALIEYIILIEVPRKAEDYLKETYPEYTLENAN
ncbi:hypothetical protein GFJ94_08080 [Flavobacterium sp. LMO8]|uniref:hypothetical protein n=1 Tax=Flavobacterium sp. LMO8 TaxID=2654244 RepID=UPI0012929799|nr:hypothetical protein [Flavobacterium sp. LMO8]MQP25020.1 hypothetical protein [Flavobacterium sp. LMO8]